MSSFVHMFNFQVPPHIVAGDAILVNTEDDCYIERLVGLQKVKAFDDKFFDTFYSLSISHSCIYEIYLCPFIKGDICLPHLPNSIFFKNFKFIKYIFLCIFMLVVHSCQ